MTFVVYQKFSTYILIFAICNFHINLAYCQTSDTALANHYFHAADSLQKDVQYDSSTRCYHQAAILYKKLGWWDNYVMCYIMKGRNYMYKRELAEAMRQLDTAMQTGMTKPGSTHTTIADCYSIFGTVYFYKGEYDRALQNYRLALNIRLQSLGRNHSSVGGTYHNMGGVYVNKGDYDHALEYYRQALNIKLQTLGRKHPSVARTYNNMGITYRNKGDYDHALEFYWQSLNIKLKTLGRKHPSTAVTYQNIGGLYLETNELNKAMEYHQLALSIFLEKLGRDHPHVGDSYTNLGIHYARQAEQPLSPLNREDCFARSLEYYDKALKIYVHAFGNYHPMVGAAYNNFAGIYHQKCLMEDGKWKKGNKKIEKNLHLPSSIKHLPLLDTALFYYQKALGALVQDYNSSSVYTNPILKIVYKKGLGWTIENVNSAVELLETFEGKAEVLEERWSIINE